MPSQLLRSFCVTRHSTVTIRGTPHMTRDIINLHSLI